MRKKFNFPGPRQVSYPPVAQIPSPQQPISQMMNLPVQNPPLYPGSPQQPLQLPSVYIKQEVLCGGSGTPPPPPQYQQQYYVPQQQQMYNGGIVMEGGGNLPDNNNDQLNSDFSLPHLSDVNLSLLDQHLSENLNDMNLNNF